MRASFKLRDFKRVGGTCVVFRHNSLYYCQCIIRGRTINVRLDGKLGTVGWFDVGLMTTERIHAFELLLRNNVPFKVDK